MAEVILSGPEGRIEARYHESAQANAPIALVLHPHPLYGGTMNNKVVYHLFHVMRRMGFSVLRFNFRGVGRSVGTFHNGVGELADAASAMDWLQLQNPSPTRCFVVGFSFGAWVGMQLLMRRPEISHFMAVAPPVNKYDFAFLSPCPTPGLVIQGDQDSVVSEASVAHFVQHIQQSALPNHGPVMYRVVPGADHFFRDHMGMMVQHCEQYVDHVLASPAHQAVLPMKSRHAKPRAALTASPAIPQEA